MNKFKPQPYLLIGAIQNYAWGTKNEKAFIPKLTGIEIEKDQPYAELWMGTHPNAPSKIEIENKQVSLATLIEKYPLEILGKRVAQKFNNKLPFLFKILSAGEALSIQAHPNKQQAEQLHAKDPEHYPDNNHKPEIAIALDNLIALAGFKQFAELITTLEQYPEITSFIGEDILSEMKSAEDISEQAVKPFVKKMYASMMRKSQSHREELLRAIEKLDQTLSLKNELSKTEEVFFDLRKIYPGADSGLFSLFLLNLIHLKKGEALFLKAGLPHAYLEGNIVECMANSDNVVRDGLTPKFQDVETLIDILTYETKPVTVQKGDLDQNEKIYETPVPEFEISQIVLRANTELKVDVKSVQVLLIIEGAIKISRDGQTQSFRKGQSILIPACLENYTIKSTRKVLVYKVEVP